MWNTAVTQRLRGYLWRCAVAAIRPANLFAAVATVTFPLAVLLPFFTLQPSLGDPLLDAVYDYVEPGVMDAKVCSVLAGIAYLFADGDQITAVILLLFSVLFPGIKLALLWMTLVRPSSFAGSLGKALETLGPWSMADVFVVSVTLLAFKSFPGGTMFTVDIGYYLFLVSVVAGMLAAWIGRRSWTA
jgi:hypothetical protein